MRTRTRAWSSIVEFYGDLVREGWRVEPMLELATLLASPPYRDGLFAYTSHEVLCVGRVEDFAPGDGELQIRYNPQGGSFRFDYIQRPDDTTPWSRECAATEWRPVIERILHERLGWFGVAA
jgi:hypothetical protein